MSDESVPAALDQVVGDLLATADGFVPANVRSDLEASLLRLRDERANVVLLGEFKRGKSTLANALVGSEVAPVGVLPLTAAVTAIRHGPVPRAFVSLHDGGRQEIPLAQIADFATEAGNPHNERGAQLLTIELPAPLLAAGLQLVDTPGIGSVYAHNTETSVRFLGQVDAAVFVLAADQPLSSVEEQLIRDAAARIPQVFFVLNKLDHLAAPERGASVAFVQDRLRALLEAEPELFALSARSGEGVAALRRRLESFGATERKDVLISSVRSLAAGFAAEAIEAARFEAHAVELPILDLERRLDEFRERSYALERAREEAAELLLQGGRRLVEETINQPLLTLAAREGPTCGEALRGESAAQAGTSPRLLAQRLDAWIDTAIRARFEQLASELEAQIAGELSSLQERYAQRVEDILADLDRAAMEVFGARAGRRAPQVRLQRRSGFTFKLHDVRGPLDQLASLAAASTPGRLGRRLVTREAEERLQLMLDRHAGRLRSDLADRVQTSVRAYAHELAVIVAEAVASIETAIERAAREQRAGQAQVSARLHELRLAERRLGELDAALNDPTPQPDLRPTEGALR
jgi:small GTP-binding protein